MEKKVTEFLCKANKKETAEKVYKVLRYAKAYALKNDLSIYDADGKLLFSIDDLKKEALELADKVEDTVKDIKKTTEKTVGTIKDLTEDAKDVVEDACEDLKEMKEDLEDAAKDTYETVRDTVEDACDDINESTGGLLTAIIGFFKKLFKRNK